MWGKGARREAHDETTVLHASSVDSSAERPAPGSANFAGASVHAGFNNAGFSSADAHAKPEAIIVRVRRHGRHLTLPVLILVAVAGASGYFIGTFPDQWMNMIAIGGAAILAIFGGLIPILAWLSRRVVVTTRRTILHSGFFVRHRREISLARVREVRTKQNPIQRLFGSGDIDLYVGAESTRIPDAPGVKELHTAIQELSERNYDEQVRATGFGA
ncbi:MAG: PH domain-containing protein [Leucobacter sp.]